jgi:ferredoxin-nitrite reductase
VSGDGSRVPGGPRSGGALSGGAPVRALRPARQLNQVERWKLERHPLEVERAVRERYAIEGAGAIATVPGEQERLKWVGLYPQRQGGDAFMLRVKVPAGRLSAAQARRIGELAGEFADGPEDHPLWGNRYCDLTTRQSVQLHWLRIESVPEVWDRLAEVGLTTLQACGDGARNVTCCPVAGIDPDEAFDASPVAQAISDFFTGNRDYANLPRKFKMSVSGCVDDCARAEINDIGMWPARAADDGTLGFNLLVGGGLSDGPRMASDIDVFVRREQAVECCRAIAQLFGELGNRENRGFSRMRYLVQELGPEEFRAQLAARADFELEPAGEELTRAWRGDHVGVHEQRRDGAREPLCYVGASVTVGRLTSSDLVSIGELAEHLGDGEVRLTVDQNFILGGIPESHVDELLATGVMRRHAPDAGPFSRGAVACTGSEFCRFAIIETKAAAAGWAAELDRRYAAALAGDGAPPPDAGAAPAGNGAAPAGNGAEPAGNGALTVRRDWGEREVIRLHVSGCPASCAQPQIADIGLRGETAHEGDRIVEAADIGLGGGLGLDAAFGDWVSGALRVSGLTDALGRALTRFATERRPGERFAEWARRVPNEELRATLEDAR